MTGIEKEGRRGLDAAKVLGAALLAGCLSVYFFAPRYLLWRLLGTTETPPEVVRATDALRQLTDPFVRLETGPTKVLEWRLFFPLLGHYLRVPASLYLALPHIGSLLALCFSVRVLRDRGIDWVGTIAGSTLVATAPWYFVSIGWLGYFDSWCILGLLVVAFARRWQFALAAALIVPWIDERFVITLPLVLLLRSWNSLRHLGPIALGVAPWALVRAVAYLRGQDDVAAAHLSDIAVAHQAIGFDTYAAGLWEGARWGWAAVAVLAVAVAKRGPVGVAAGGLVLVGTLAVNLGIAEDVSRSASVVGPLVLAGLCAASRFSAGFIRPAIVVVAALNLVTPARHVMGVHRIRILYLPAEMARNGIPLGDFSASSYGEDGVRAAQAGHPAQALEKFNLALRLSPADPVIWMNRGLVRAGAGDRAGALSDLEESLKLSSDRPWPYHDQVVGLISQIRQSPAAH